MRTKISLTASVIGLIVSIHIGVAPLLPWGDGCVHGWLFDCTAVRNAAASALLGLPMWLWGAAWFVAMIAAVAWTAWSESTLASCLAIALTIAGWLMVSHLRGVELFIIGKACLECWITGVAAIVAGVDPLSTLGRKHGKAVLGLVVAGMAAAFLLASLREPLPPRERPEIPGWTWVERGREPIIIEDLMIEGMETPTLVLVHSHNCPYCEELREGLLADEVIQLMLSELCRVVVDFDDLLDSPLILEVDSTPTLLLLQDGAVTASLSGHFEEPELIDLILRSTSESG
jgi:uncharacterized membrane protein